MNDNRGYVYIMINPSYDGLVKIGKTTKEPEERAKELSSATGVATPFIVVYKRLFNDCSMAEKAIHTILAEKGFRINNNREFFKVSVDEAINTLVKLTDYDNFVLEPDGDEGDEYDESCHFLTMAHNYHLGDNDYLKDYDKALDYYRKYIVCGSLPSCGWEGMSDIYLEQNKISLAIECKLKQLECEKKDFGDDPATLSFLYVELGELYFLSKKVEDRENCQKAWELFFDSVRKTPVEEIDEGSAIAYGCISFLELLQFRHMVFYGTYKDVFKKHKSLILNEIQQRLSVFDSTEIRNNLNAMMYYINCITE